MYIVQHDLRYELLLPFVQERIIMKSITIHGLDDGLDKCIRDRAREKGLSINKTLKEVLGQAFGISDSLCQDHREEFVDLCGVWSDDDVLEFKKHLQASERIDMSDWQ
jgi:hypothetical protein